MSGKLARHWFLIGLATVLLIGFLWPGQLEWLANIRILRNGIVVSVLFLMAWPLETGVLWKSIRRPWPALLASLINAGVMPLMAWGFSTLLVRDLGIGLLVSAAIPCTLASAAVWTRRAGGNDATAILVTLITNATCFLIAPFWLVTTTGSQVEIEFLPMAAELAVLVVLPMAAGQLLRHVAGTGAWATRHKIPLAVVAQIGILTMVLFGAVQSGVRLQTSASNGFPLSAAALVVMECVVLALHLAGFGLAWFLAGIAGLDQHEQPAVAIAGSQKTLMIGLKIGIDHYGGLTILPMVAYHVTQLLVDTVLADWIRRSRDRTTAESQPKISQPTP